MLELKKKCTSKNTIKRMKRQPTEWEKIFTNHIPVKDLYPGYIELLQFNNKTQTTQFKNEQRIWIDILPQKIYKWPINTWKICSTPLIFGKYKSKPQWDNISYLLRWLLLRKQKIMSVGKDVDKLECLYVAGEKAKWYSCYRKWHGGLSKY